MFILRDRSTQTNTGAVVFSFRRRYVQLKLKNGMILGFLRRSGVAAGTAANALVNEYLSVGKIAEAANVGMYFFTFRIHYAYMIAIL